MPTSAKSRSARNTDLISCSPGASLQRPDATSERFDAAGADSAGAARAIADRRAWEPKSVYDAAVVGCGRIGCAFDDDPKRGGAGSHCGAYSSSPRFNLIALCDIDRDKCSRYAHKYNVPGYEGVGELLRVEQPDVLSICTRANDHEPLVSAAIDAGVRAIYCEKPLADSLAAADAIVAMCRRAGVTLLVGHQRRFDPLHRALARYIREGRLGDIRQATCYYTAGIANTGSHLIDLLRMLLGDVARVRAETRAPGAQSEPPNDPTLNAWLTFASGATAVLQGCEVSDYTIFEISVLGSRGRVRLMSHGHEIEYEDVRDHPRYTGYKGLHRARSPIAVQASETPLLLAMKNLAECLDGDSEPLSSGSDGLAALEVIAALLESADTGGTLVELPLTNRNRRITS